MRVATVFTELLDDSLKLMLLDVSTFMEPLIEQWGHGSVWVSDAPNPLEQSVASSLGGVEEGAENPRNGIITPWIGGRANELRHPVL